MTVATRFAFEDDIDAELTLMPLAARYCLDRVGAKLSLAAWQALSREARCAVTQLAVETEGARVEALARVVALAHAAGVTTTPRPPIGDPAPWNDVGAFEAVAARAAALGLEVARARWDRLTDVERFALHHVTAPTKRSVRARAALAELGLTPPRAAFGVFVGGGSTRMGGAPKGMLPTPGTGVPLVVRALALGRALGCRVALVGDATPYRGVTDALALDDEPRGAGPGGGLAALLAWAGDAPALAFACDMPHTTLDDFDALLLAHPDALCVAGRRGLDAPWEPFFARYDAPRALPVVRALIASGERSLQAYLAALDARAFDARPDACDDWDSPGDIG